MPESVAGNQAEIVAAGRAVAGREFTKGMVKARRIPTPRFFRAVAATAL